MRLTFRVRVTLDAPSLERGRVILDNALRLFATCEYKRLMAPNVVRDLDVSWVISEGMLESESPEHLESKAEIERKKIEFARQKAILWHKT